MIKKPITPIKGQHEMFDNLSEKFSDAFKNLQGKGKITESNIESALKEVRTALLEADVNFKVVKEFIAGVKEEALGEKVIRGLATTSLTCVPRKTIRSIRRRE